MPISYQVFLDGSRVPGTADWLQALRDSGFGVTFAAETDLATHSGYLPCPDERVGFELYREPFSPAHAEIGATGIEAVGTRDTAFTFRFSGRAADREAAVAAAATLAAMGDGILFDEESGHFVAAASALSWARNENYRPIASYRARGRRRTRIRASTVVRLLMLALITIVFAMLFG